MRGINRRCSRLLRLVPSRTHSTGVIAAERGSFAWVRRYITVQFRVECIKGLWTFNTKPEYDICVPAGFNLAVEPLFNRFRDRAS